jgi:hypothetical protein
MDVRKLLLAALVSFAAMFVLSGVWYMVIAEGFYRENFPMQREQVVPWIIALGYLLLALLMSYAYPIGYKGGAPWAEGLRFGILIGLILGCAQGLIVYGWAEVAFVGVLVDAIFAIVHLGVGGLLIGLVYGRSASSAEA